MARPLDLERGAADAARRRRSLRRPRRAAGRVVLPAAHVRARRGPAARERAHDRRLALRPLGERARGRARAGARQPAAPALRRDRSRAAPAARAQRDRRARALLRRRESRGGCRRRRRSSSAQAPFSSRRELGGETIASATRVEGARARAGYAELPRPRHRRRCRSSLRRARAGARLARGGLRRRRLDRRGGARREPTSASTAGTSRRASPTVPLLPRPIALLSAAAPRDAARLAVARARGARRGAGRRPRSIRRVADLRGGRCARRSRRRPLALAPRRRRAGRRASTSARSSPAPSCSSSTRRPGRASTPAASRVRRRRRRRSRRDEQHSGFRYVAAASTTASRPSTRSACATSRSSVRVRGPVTPAARRRRRAAPRRGPTGAAFECSDPLLNRSGAVGRRTVDLCSHDAYLDCPTREQRALDRRLRRPPDGRLHDEPGLVARALERRADGLAASRRHAADGRRAATSSTATPRSSPTGRCTGCTRSGTSGATRPTARRSRGCCPSPSACCAGSSRSATRRAADRRHRLGDHRLGVGLDARAVRGAERALGARPPRVRGDRGRGRATPGAPRGRARRTPGVARLRALLGREARRLRRPRPRRRAAAPGEPARAGRGARGRPRAATRASRASPTR